MDGFGFGYGYGLAPNLVLLSDGPAQAKTRDVLSSERLGSVAFNPKFTPVDLTILPDQDGNGIHELGMLGQGSAKVELRDAITGDLINHLWFARDFRPQQVVTLPDLNGNISAEVGVVLGKADETDRVVIKASLTEERIETLEAKGKCAEFDLL
jgi:hypothetical protein